MREMELSDFCEIPENAVAFELDPYEPPSPAPNGITWSVPPREIPTFEQTQTHIRVYPNYTRRRRGFDAAPRRRRAVEFPGRYVEPKVKQPGPARPSLKLGHGLSKRLDALHHQISKPSPKLLVWECARQARNSCLPRWQRGGSGIPNGMYTHIIDETRRLLAEHNLCLRVAPSELDQLIRTALDELFCSYRPSRDRQRLRYRAEDAKAARRVLGGILSNKQVNRFKAAAKKHGFRLDRHQVLTALQVAWLAASKSIVSRHGALPVVRVARTLQAHGFTASEDRLRKLVTPLLKTLVELGLIRCTHEAYGPNFCRKYEIRGQSYRLPFIAEFLGHESRMTIARRMAEVKAQTTLKGKFDALLSFTRRSSTETIRAFGLSLVPTTQHSTSHHVQTGISRPFGPFHSEILN
jgi:hypothetical protein